MNSLEACWNLYEGKPEAWADHFTAILAFEAPEALESVLSQIYDRVLASEAAARLQGLEAMAGLAHAQEPARIPLRVTDSLLGYALGLMASAPEAEIREAACAAAAALLGAVAAGGALGHMEAHLSRLGTEAAYRRIGALEAILASPHLLLPALARHTREGKAVLEPLVLPFLRALGGVSCGLLIHILEEDLPRTARASYLRVLKAFAPEALPGLHARLGHRNPRLVRDLLGILVSVGSPSSFEPALGCLGHREVQVRNAALKAVLALDAAGAETALVGMLPTASEDVLRTLLKGLGELRSPRAVPALVSLAASKGGPLRNLMLETLGRTREPAAFRFIASNLALLRKVGNPEQARTMLWATAKSLSDMGTPQALGTLAMALQREKDPINRKILACWVEPRAWPTAV